MRTTPNGHNAALIDSATLCLMNELRVEHGLHALHDNDTLASIASGQAGDMVRGGYFGDDSLSGASPTSRIKASGYSLPTSHVRLLTAQNIGWGTGPNATPAGIVKAWMQSPPHRRIILTAAYRDAGVGVSPTVPNGSRSRWLGATYAVEFGARER
ncbi:MAG TPA: CAP domain-containing protein [Solirubrobacteraceae bacterium]|nr:CAP domain-containing protein [Solirubrobacteraceae bacterium]